MTLTPRRARARRMKRTARKKLESMLAEAWATISPTASTTDLASLISARTFRAFAPRHTEMIAKSKTFHLAARSRIRRYIFATIMIISTVVMMITTMTITTKEIIKHATAEAQAILSEEEAGNAKGYKLQEHFLRVKEGPRSRSARHTKVNANDDDVGNEEELVLVLSLRPHSCSLIRI